MDSNSGMPRAFDMTPSIELNSYRVGRLRSARSIFPAKIDSRFRTFGSDAEERELSMTLTLEAPCLPGISKQFHVCKYSLHLLHVFFLLRPDNASRDLEHLGLKELERKQCALRSDSLRSGGFVRTDHDTPRRDS